MYKKQYGTSQAPQGHAPSRYRQLARDFRKGYRTPEEFLAEARELSDPGFRAKALFLISTASVVSLEQGSELAEEAFGELGKVERGWRAAEVLSELAKEAEKWRFRDKKLPEHRAAKEKLMAQFLKAVEDLGQGKGRSDAIQGVAKNLPGSQLTRLLTMAIDNPGFQKDDTRAVIRAMAAARVDPAPALKELESVENVALRGRLLGYLQIQLRKGKRTLPTPSPLELALGLLEEVEDQTEQLEFLRYLATVAGTKAELETVMGHHETLKELAAIVRLHSTLAGQADKQGERALAREWLFKAFALSCEIVEPHDRAAVRINIGQGIARTGQPEEALEVFEAGLKDAGQLEPEEKAEGMRKRIHKTMHKMGLVEEKEFVPESSLPATPAPAQAQVATAEQKPIVEPEPVAEETAVSEPSAPPVPTEAKVAGPVSKAVPEPKSVPEEMPVSEEKPVPKQGSRHVLALYDTYKGGLKPVHFRALARAAPLCLAFELDLMLVGFPTKSLEDFVRETVKETAVGKGGRLLEELMGQGRLTLLEADWKNPPQDFGPGLVVGTSSKPDRTKAVELRELVEKARAKDGESRLILVMGLGKKGLPPSLLESVPYHLELTGKGVPLETATVMGVLAERLRGL